MSGSRLAEDVSDPPFEGRVSISDNATLEVVLKINELCNINCTYCYMYNVGNELYKELPKQASIETCVSVAGFIAREFKLRQPAGVRLIIHGGEPTLMKPKAFDDRLEAIWGHLRSNISCDELAKIQLAITTNATLVSEAWIDLFERWNISVTVSLDGPAAVHDATRQDKRGRGTHAAVMAGIRRLQEAHKQGRIQPVGCLCVINPAADGAAVYRYIVDEAGIAGLAFLLPFMTWDNHDPAVVDGVSRFLCAAYDEWEADIRSGKRVRVRNFARAFRSLWHRQLVATDEHVRISHQVVVVESDGTIMPEESLRPTYNGRYADLFVATSSAGDILRHPAFAELIVETFTRSNECEACALVDHCATGLSQARIGMRASSDLGFARRPVYCEALVELYARAANSLNKWGRPALIERAPPTSADGTRLLRSILVGQGGLDDGPVSSI